jgi:hypothetical protein
MLFATFILLAHSVIPHHHHQNEICVGIKYSHGHSFDCHKIDSPTNDPVNQNGDGYQCTLKLPAVLPSSPGRQECSHIDFTDDFLSKFFYLASDKSDGADGNDLAFEIKHSFETPTISAYIETSLILRGPPFVV